MSAKPEFYAVISYPGPDETVMGPYKTLEEAICIAAGFKMEASKHQNLVRSRVELRYCGRTWVQAGGSE